MIKVYEFLTDVYKDLVEVPSDNERNHSKRSYSLEITGIESERLEQVTKSTPNVTVSFFFNDQRNKDSAKSSFQMFEDAEALRLRVFAESLKSKHGLMDIEAGSLERDSTNHAHVFSFEFSATVIKK